MNYSRSASHPAQINDIMSFTQVPVPSTSFFTKIKTASAPIYFVPYAQQYFL